MRILTALFFLFTALPCSAMISFGFLTKEQAKELGVELTWQPAGPKSVRVELSIDTTGKLKAFAKEKFGNRVDLRVSGGEKKQSLLQTALKEDRSKDGRLKVSFTISRSELHDASLWITQYLQGVANVVRMADFIALDEIDPPAKPKPEANATVEPTAPAAESASDG